MRKLIIIVVIVIIAGTIFYFAYWKPKAAAKKGQDSVNKAIEEKKTEEVVKTLTETEIEAKVNDASQSLEDRIAFAQTALNAAVTLGQKIERKRLLDNLKSRLTGVVTGDLV